MTPFQKRLIEAEFRQFTGRHFVKPKDCKNHQQVSYYIHELCIRIEELRQNEYVPDFAYQLLAEYQARQNGMVLKEFIASY